MWLVYSLVLFFFCMQKTAYEMRISDWSSDVCSSDLIVGVAARHRGAGLRDQPQQIPIADEDAGKIGEGVPADGEAKDAEGDLAMLAHQILKVQILCRIG